MARVVVPVKGYVCLGDCPVTVGHSGMGMIPDDVTACPVLVHVD